MESSSGATEPSTPTETPELDSPRPIGDSTQGRMRGLKGTRFRVSQAFVLRSYSSAN